MSAHKETFTLEVPRDLGTAFSQLLVEWQHRLPVEEASDEKKLVNLIDEIIKISRIEGSRTPSLNVTVVKEFNRVSPLLMKLIGATRISIGGNGILLGGEKFSIMAEVLNQNVLVAEFRMSRLSGCSAVCVLNHLRVSEEFRGIGIGSLLHSLRLNAAKSSGFALAQCTTLIDNEPQIKILKKFGWHKSHEFFNPKTENTVLMWSLDLTTYNSESFANQRHGGDIGNANAFQST